MLAKIAFVDDFLLRVTVAGTVWAGRYAAAATDTQFIVDFDGTVAFILVRRAGRASLHAGGRVAMHTVSGLEVSGRFPGRPFKIVKVRVLPLDPVSPVAGRNFIFDFASCQTSLAVDTSG
jgi:hypothetical protein